MRTFEVVRAVIGALVLIALFASGCSKLEIRSDREWRGTYSDGPDVDHAVSGKGSTTFGLKSTMACVHLEKVGDGGFLEARIKSPASAERWHRTEGCAPIDFCADEHSQP